MVAPADIKSRFPEFSSVSDARIQLFIDDAELEVDETRWGDLYDKGVSYLTAHLLTIGESTAGQTGGTVGGVAPIGSQNIGDVSVSWRHSSLIDDKVAYMNSTTYGQEYYRLMRRVGMGAVAVTE